jgi:hypothetical protein
LALHPDAVPEQISFVGAAGGPVEITMSRDVGPVSPIASAFRMRYGNQLYVGNTAAAFGDSVVLDWTLQGALPGSDAVSYDAGPGDLVDDLGRDVPSWSYYPIT